MLLPLSNDLRNETLMPEKHENEKPKKGALDRELVMTQNFTNFMTFLVLTPNQWSRRYDARSGIRKAFKHPPLSPFGSPPPLSSRVFNLNTQIIIFGKKNHVTVIEIRYRLMQHLLNMAQLSTARQELLWFHLFACNPLISRRVLTATLRRCCFGLFPSVAISWLLPF